MNQAERSSLLGCLLKVGTALSADWMRPFALEKSVTASPCEVKSAESWARIKSGGSTLFLQKNVHRMLGGNVLRACVPERSHVDTGK